MYSIECLITQGIAHTYICMYIQEIVVNPRQLNSNFLQINFIVYNIHIGLTSYIKITSVRGFASWAKRSLSMNYRTVKGWAFCVSDTHPVWKNKVSHVPIRRQICINGESGLHDTSISGLLLTKTYFQHKSGNVLMCYVSPLSL